ncbi:MAG: hypothetical protein AAB922_06965 [Patescibacteria group bacterium]
MDKLKIKQLGSLELIDAIPELNKDYLLTIRISRSGTETDEEDSENPVIYYVCKYINTEKLEEAGTNKSIKIRSGKSQSQKLRWTLMAIADKIGEDPETYYRKKMSEIIEFYDQKY